MWESPVWPTICQRKWAFIFGKIQLLMVSGETFVIVATGSKAGAKSSKKLTLFLKGCIVLKCVKDKFDKKRHVNIILPCI